MEYLKQCFDVRTINITSNKSFEIMLKIMKKNNKIVFITQDPNLINFMCMSNPGVFQTNEPIDYILLHHKRSSSGQLNKTFKSLNDVKKLFFEELKCGVCYEHFDGMSVCCTCNNAICDICITKLQEKKCPYCRKLFR